MKIRGIPPAFRSQGKISRADGSTCSGLANEPYPPSSILMCSQPRPVAYDNDQTGNNFGQTIKLGSQIGKKN